MYLLDENPSQVYKRRVSLCKMCTKEETMSVKTDTTVSPISPVSPVNRFDGAALLAKGAFVAIPLLFAVYAPVGIQKMQACAAGSSEKSDLFPTVFLGTFCMFLTAFFWQAIVGMASAENKVSLFKHGVVPFVKENGLLIAIQFSFLAAFALNAVATVGPVYACSCKC
jgi:hypothetical protein